MVRKSNMMTPSGDIVTLHTFSHGKCCTALLQPTRQSHTATFLTSLYYYTCTFQDPFLTCKWCFVWTVRLKQSCGDSPAQQQPAQSPFYWVNLLFPAPNSEKKVINKCITIWNNNIVNCFGVEKLLANSILWCPLGILWEQAFKHNKTNTHSFKRLGSVSFLNVFGRNL